MNKPCLNSDIDTFLSFQLSFWTCRIWCLKLHKILRYINVHWVQLLVLMIVSYVFSLLL